MRELAAMGFGPLDHGGRVALLRRQNNYPYYMRILG